MTTTYIGSAASRTSVPAGRFRLARIVNLWTHNRRFRSVVYMLTTCVTAMISLVLVGAALIMPRLQHAYAVVSYQDFDTPAYTYVFLLCAGVLLAAALCLVRTADKAPLRTPATAPSHYPLALHNRDHTP